MSEEFYIKTPEAYNNRGSNDTMHTGQLQTLPLTSSTENTEFKRNKEEKNSVVKVLLV